MHELSIVTSELTESDLTRVVAKAATAAAVGSELPAGGMQRLGSMLTRTGIYSSLEEELKKLESLTLDDLRDAAAAYPWEPLLVASTKH